MLFTKQLYAPLCRHSGYPLTSSATSVAASSADAFALDAWRRLDDQKCLAVRVNLPKGGDRYVIRLE